MVVIIMNNEEIARELEETQRALGDTQEALLQVCEVCARLRCVLRVKGVVDDLDNSFIKLTISEDEYTKKYKEQNSLSSLYSQLFDPTRWADIIKNNNGDT